jgi:cytochrome P450
MSQTDVPPAGEADFEVLFTPEHYADPHPIYRRMRTEAPIWHSPDDAWLLTRYADCEAILRDTRWSSNPAHRAGGPSEEFNAREGIAAGGSVLLFMDPPDHTRIRNLVNRSFTPKAVTAWRERISEIVDDLLDEAAERGRIELISDFAFQVPVIVICELMGVPIEDRHLFGPWSSDASRLLDGVLDDETMNRGLLGAMQLISYLNPLIEERRTHPRDDLLSQIVQAEEQGDRLSEEELRALVVLVFIAGHETTTNLIGNGMKALLDHPDQLRRLQQDPTLIGTAVEEVLRYDGPVHVTGRIATEDLEVGGQRFPAGSQLVALLAAANRDPEEFPDPDRFDVGRAPNHHLTFSKGIHHCLGAALARLEGQQAIGRLVERFPDLSLVTTAPTYRDHFVLRGFTELEIDLG